MKRQGFSSFSQQQSSGGYGGGGISFGGGGSSYGGGGSSYSGSFRNQRSGLSFGGGSGGGGVGYSFGSGGSGFSSSGLSVGGGYSSSSSLSIGGGGGLIGNEKSTMINLNDRLATYLEKVKSLEKSNSELELELKQFQIGTALKPIDFAAYDAIIKPLRDKILQVHLGNARVALDLDNASLAARDFQSKYENELNTRQMVEGDIMELRAMKEDYIRNCKDMENDITASQEELVYLRKNHEEELVILRQQVAGTVSVEVQAEQGPDLNVLMAEMRAQYEASCKSNQDAMKTWFETQVESQTVAAVQVNEAAESSKLQLSELKRQYQSLQTEYDSIYSVILSLESTIEGINDNYAGQLCKLKMTISNLEIELGGARATMIQKNNEYTSLLNVKMQLEKEIATYRELLQGTGVSGQETTTVTKTMVKTATMIK
ncbi:keratin, type I cytoskeletal 19-like [Rhinoraja longicauda]